MAEIAVATKSIEGIVDAVERVEGRQPSLTIRGQKWFMEPQERFQRAWVEPRKGMTVRIEVDPWTKRDGSIGWTVKQIEDISPFENVDMEPETQPYLSKREDSWRTPSQIMRTDALRIASEALGIRAPHDYDTDAFAAAAVAMASVYFQYIESGLEG